MRQSLGVVFMPKKNKKKKKKEKGRKGRRKSSTDFNAASSLPQGTPSFLVRHAAKLRIRFKGFPRKTRRIILAAVSLCLILALLTNDFLRAMEVVKEVLILISNVIEKIRVESLDQNRIAQLELYKQQLEKARQECEVKLQKTNLDLLDSAPGSALYQALEAKKKEQEDRLRRIEAQLSETNEKLQTLADTNDQPVIRSALPDSTPKTDKGSERVLQEEKQRNPHTTDTQNRVVAERDSLLQRIRAAETALDDLVIEGEIISFHDERHSPSQDTSPGFSPESLAVASPFDSTLQRGTWGQRQPLISAKRDATSLRRTITERYTARLRGIYQNELKKNPNLKGRITVRIRLNAQGIVVESPEVIESTLTAPEMETRVLASIAEWDDFGETLESQQNTVFRVTFKFGE